MNMKEMLSYVSKRDWDSLVNMMIKSINSLAEVGADFAVIASNTPHVVFDRVKQIAKIPLLNIVEETCKKAEAINCKRLGLLGTGFTMRENFYKDTFAAHNKEIVLPNIDEQQYIHH
ncbi:MAG: aspartate racemase, partial [Eubacterium sp.]|nr:aspartate racemase [Eubacterium sp.]